MASTPKPSATERLLQAIRDCAAESNGRPSAETYRRWQADHPEAATLPVLRKWLGSWDAALRQALGDS
jgi:Homing endonuclease associated repeat